MDFVRRHYEACDAQDTIYVENSLVSSLSAGRLTWEELFLNFFAANSTKDWADPTNRPELVYIDDDTWSYGTIAVAHDIDPLVDAHSWLGEQAPDDWAGRYKCGRGAGSAT